MARLLTHLTRELEAEVVRAVEESNDGYPKHLDDLRGAYESITEADIDAVSEVLWEGACEGRDCGRDDGPRITRYWIDASGEEWPVYE